MALRIVVPNHFRHAAEITDSGAGRDPRMQTFREDRVDIDLRSCVFLRPAAALWCVAYPLLAAGKGSGVRLLVPEQKGVATYLKSLGLFSLLKVHSVEVDDRGIADRRDPQIVMPLTEFRTRDDVDRIANEAHDALRSAGLGAINLYPFVSEVFSELGLNAVEHAESPIGAFGFIQFYEFEQGKRFICGVIDGGIGIRRSLEKNPTLRDRITYDWDAIELAVRERVTAQATVCEESASSAWRKTCVSLAGA